MSQLMQTVQGAISSLGNVFSGSPNPSAGGLPQFGPVDPGTMAAIQSNPSLANLNPGDVAGMTGPSASTAGGGTGAGAGNPQAALLAIAQDPNADPLTKAVVLQMLASQPSGLQTAMSGLGPYGLALMQARLRQPELAGMAHPAQPSTQQPGPVAISSQAPPASPIATAALIEQLL